MESLNLRPLVSVIIVNYNTTSLTRACIQSVLTHTTADLEIILVDNASIDRSIETLQLEFPMVKFIFNQENIGFGRANNLGIKMAKGVYCFFLNSDTMLTSDAIGSFIAYMQNPKHEKVACCGGDLITLDGKQQVSYGNFPSLAEVFAALGPGLFYKRFYRKHLCSGVKVYRSEPHTVDYVSGADLFVRKRVLTEIGSFDEDFFLYFEETELAFRMKKNGYLSVILPDVRIVHLEGGSHDSENLIIKKELYNHHRLLFFQKCYGLFTSKVAKVLYRLQQVIFR